MDRLPASSLASLQKYSGSAPALEIVSVRPAGLGWGYGGPLTGAMAAGYNLTWLQEEGRPLRPSWAVEESPDSTEQGARRKPGSGNRQLEPQRPRPARMSRSEKRQSSPLQPEAWPMTLLAEARVRGSRRKAASRHTGD